MLATSSPAARFFAGASVPRAGASRPCTGVRGRSSSLTVRAGIPPVNFAGMVPPFPNPNQGAHSVYTCLISIAQYESALDSAAVAEESLRLPHGTLSHDG